MLRFLLNGRWTSAAVPPSMTVLDYLRGEARLTGTKEGCAEGDCGACTIAIAPLDGDAPRYKAVNACLMLVPQIDGHAVVTVEGLARADGSLHPVQQALVEADATQCGFCTPGFAMAMFAFVQEEARGDEAIHEALAGNLCRCTGYRPIVEACRGMRAAPPGCAAQAVTEVASQRGDYRHDGQLHLAPASLDELARAKARYPDAILLGGGTDLCLRASKGREAFPAVIATARVAELKAISEAADTLTLGGAVTYTEALPTLDRHFPSFAALVRRIGSRQIRNLGTFAGNLANASPIGDTIPCLIALDARVTLRSLRGRRQVAAEDFILGYRKTVLAADEFIESIAIPLLAPQTRFVAYKLSKRFDQDISTVVAAFRLRVEGDTLCDLRAAYGGMAEKPARARHVEAALTGRPWRVDGLHDIDPELARDFSPLTDHRGSAAYRLTAAANLVRRLQLESTGGDPVQVWAL
jgi:xanthine dehydrogenase small subunit